MQLSTYSIGKFKKLIPQELREFTPAEMPLSEMIQLIHLDMHCLKQELFLYRKEAVGLQTNSGSQVLIIICIYISSTAIE